MSLPKYTREMKSVKTGRQSDMITGKACLRGAGQGEVSRVAFIKSVHNRVETTTLGNQGNFSAQFSGHSFLWWTGNSCSYQRPGLWFP